MDVVSLVSSGLMGSQSRCGDEGSNTSEEVVALISKRALLTCVGVSLGTETDALPSPSCLAL